MPLVVFQVVPSLNRWAVIHKGLALATFSTRMEAETAALAIARRHAPKTVAEVDVISDGRLLNEIRVF